MLFPCECGTAIFTPVGNVARGDVIAFCEACGNRLLIRGGQATPVGYQPPVWGPALLSGNEDPSKPFDAQDPLSTGAVKWGVKVGGTEPGLAFCPAGFLSLIPVGRLALEKPREADATPAKDPRLSWRFLRATILGMGVVLVCGGMLALGGLERLRASLAADSPARETSGMLPAADRPLRGETKVAARRAVERQTSSLPADTVTPVTHSLAGDTDNPTEKSGRNKRRMRRVSSRAAQEDGELSASAAREDRELSARAAQHELPPRASRSGRGEADTTRTPEEDAAVRQPASDPGVTPESPAVDHAAADPGVTESPAVAHAATDPGVTGPAVDHAAADPGVTPESPADRADPSSQAEPSESTASAQVALARGHMKQRKMLLAIAALEKAVAADPQHTKA
ncbi:hypothetical protein ACFL6C_08935, partial [Myxococcota bacterium]